MQVHKLFI